MLKLNRVAGKKNMSDHIFYYHKNVFAIYVLLGKTFKLLRLSTSVVCSSTAWNIKVSGCLWNFLFHIDALWRKLNETNSERIGCFRLQTKGICLYTLRNTFADRSCFSKWPFFLLMILINSGPSRLWLILVGIRNKQMGEREGRWWRSSGDSDVRLMLPLMSACRKPLKMFLEQIMLPHLTSSTPHLNYIVTGKSPLVASQLFQGIFIQCFDFLQLSWKRADGSSTGCTGSSGCRRYRARGQPASLLSRLNCALTTPPLT